MSTIELQNLLIEKIKTTNNSQLLEEASRLFDVSLDESDFYQFSEKELLDIHEAQQQIKNGESFSHYEANEIVNEWLKK